MGEAVFDLVGPVKNLREASPQALVQPPPGPRAGSRISQSGATGFEAHFQSLEEEG